MMEKSPHLVEANVETFSIRVERFIALRIFV